MSNILEGLPEDEGEKGKEQPLQEGMPMGDAAKKIRMLMDTGEIEIIGEDTRNPIKIKLPASIIRIVQHEQNVSVRIKNPAKQLTHDYEEWEDCKSDEVRQYGQGMATCFGMYGDMTLFYWTLEHFSDEKFPLSEKQKSDLAFHTYDYAESTLGNNVSSVMTSEDTDSMEYCWYFLVRLMAIEEKVANKDQSDPLVQEHRRLIRNHYALFIKELNDMHEVGFINVASPKEEIERRLIELIRSQPRLKPYATPIIQGHEELKQEAESLKLLVEERETKLHGIGKKDADDDENIDFEVELRNQSEALKNIRILVNTMTPESDDDQVWHHPLEYIEKMLADKHVLFYSTVFYQSNNDELSDGQKFDYSLLDNLAKKGFRHWLQMEPETNLYSTHKWLKDNNDSRSMKELIDVLQQYLSLQRGNRIPSIRDFLLFPQASEPLNVTKEVQYWQQMWEAKERAKAELRIYMSLMENEQDDALAWMQASEDKKFIAIGDIDVFRGVSYSNKCVTPDKSLVIKHQAARPQYRVQNDKLILWAAFPYAAHEVGKKVGWGDHESSALPVKSNKRLIEAFQSGDLKEFSLEFRVLYAGNSIDAVIFTEEKDHENAEESFDPSKVDADAPLVGAGR